jgi:hypothetical protein
MEINTDSFLKGGGRVKHRQRVVLVSKWLERPPNEKGFGLVKRRWNALDEILIQLEFPGFGISPKIGTSCW